MSKSHSRRKQFLRFCGTGAICYGANIVALWSMVELLHVHYIPAYIITFFLGHGLGYWLNKRFTFAIKEPLDHGAIVRYLLVSGFMLAISTTALHVLVEWLRMHYLVATALIAVANAPLGFVIHRIVTYRITT